MKLDGSVLYAGLAGLVLCLGARAAVAGGSEIVVVDPRGNPVPCELFRIDPSPKVHLGHFPTGRLSLPYVCTQDMYFEAVPDGNYGVQEAYCGSDGMVHIQVTPAYMYAQLKDNLRNALAVGNHAAVAQIATELAARVNQANGAEVAYYRNLAVAETARVVSPSFDHSQVWRFGNAGAAITSEYSEASVPWRKLSQSTDLLTCKSAAGGSVCDLVPTQRFQSMLDNTVSHRNARHAAISPSWLQNYSHVTTGEVLFDKLPKAAFQGSAAPP